jgi:polar amino acid transport system substrate-binding protein
VPIFVGKILGCNRVRPWLAIGLGCLLPIAPSIAADRTIAADRNVPTRLEISEASEAPEAQTEGPTIARIRQRGYLNIGIQIQVKPLAFGEPDRPQGLEVELAQQLAQGLLGRADRIRWVPLLHRDRLTALVDGRVDLLIAGLTRTHGRQRIIRMSAPYYIDGLGLIQPRQAQPRQAQPRQPQPRQLGQGPIAVLEGSEAIAVVKSRWPQAKLLGVTSYQAAYQALETGQAQTFVGDRSILVGWQQDHPDYDLRPDRLSSAPLAIGIAKGQDDLAQAIDRQLLDLTANGWLQRATQRWGLP